MLASYMLAYGANFICFSCQLQDAGELQSCMVGIPLRYTCTCNQLITYVGLIRTQYMVHLLNLAGVAGRKKKTMI
jgi:hypothetical protein